MIPPLLEAPLLFLIGICVGSFLNVVIYRLPRGMSLIHPRSRCGFCGSSISALRNIPLASFLLSGGACEACGYRYSSRYFWIELFGGLIALVLYSIYGWSFEWVLYFSFAATLLALSVIDIDFFIIPDSMSIGAMVVTLAIAALPLTDHPLNLMSSLMGAGVGMGGFYLLSRLFYFIRHEEGLGLGDVKLMGFVGAMLGVEGVFITVMVGSFLGLFVSILSAGGLSKAKNKPFPFGPSLSIGAFSALMGLERLLPF